MNVYTELRHLHCITEEDFVLFKDDNVGLCGVDCARLSYLLLAQLTSVRKYRTFNSFSVTDVIQTLEGVGRAGSCVKGEEAFKHQPLRGFWKAHFFDAKFLMQNLINEWGVAYKNSPKFEELCLRVAEEEEKKPTTYGWQGRLSHEFTMAGYDQRTKKKNQTGEWLIFAKHENCNYYLCIAQHSSTKKGDEAIYNMLEQYCKDQYPFLFPSAA